MIVNARTPGKLRLLILDLTRNTCGFEHRTSDGIASSIKKGGVILASDTPLHLETISDYVQALKTYNANFNALLLFAHGRIDPKDGNVSEVNGPVGISEWYSLGEISDNLKDKFVALCVCYGFCEDAHAAFIDNGAMALTLLAPVKPLSAHEAQSFFPCFFAELNNVSITQIDPNEVRTAMNNFNSQAGNKMAIYSDGLSSSV